MRRFVFFNHQISPASEAFLSSVSFAALYGKGIFTTIAIYDKKPFLWEKHWRRLNENAEKIGIDLSEFAEETVRDSLLEIIEKNKVTSARARITFFDERASGIWQFETKRKTGILIMTADFRKIETDFNLTVSPFRINSTSPLAGVKSCNYLENLLVLEEAKRCEFDEAIRLNEKNEIVSASTANIFWIKNKEIFTPALETGCLAGTMRELLLENFAVRQVKASLDEIIEADEIFLTSAGIGICPANFENIKKRSLSNIPKIKNILDLPDAKS